MKRRSKKRVLSLQFLIFCSILERTVSECFIVIGKPTKNFSVYTGQSPTFSLDNFEGPLELLLYLIQKNEIDICTIPISHLTSQFMEALDDFPEVETSSETLTLAATLLLLKSQKLLPQEALASEQLEDDPRIELIQSLIEYCRFKDAAKALSLREEEQKAHFPRATSPFRKELGSGLEEIGIENLKTLLLDLLKKSAFLPQQVIKEEEWQISHKLERIRLALTQEKKIPFTSLSSEAQGRSELIVLFLALLEMMKHQEARVVRENEILYIICYESGT